jgi:RNA polymerase sigma-70 factor (ECF subfamily)
MPLYAFARARGLTPDDAQDATQGFFEQLIERRDLAALHPSRGRFRAFLLVAFKHFLANERDKARALKRGGGQVIVPIDAEQRTPVEPAHDETPERLYEREWARAVVSRSVARLSAEVPAESAPVVRHIAAVLRGDGADVPIRDLASSLGMTEGAARVALHRMRQRLRKTLLDEIAQTVESDAEVEDELRHLMASLS